MVKLKIYHLGSDSIYFQETYDNTEDCMAVIKACSDHFYTNYRVMITRNGVEVQYQPYLRSYALAGGAALGNPHTYTLHVNPFTFRLA